MYYIETINNDSFHKYVASMTGSSVKGMDLDEGVYMFDDEKTCDRAIGVINKTWGSGIWAIVEKKTTEQKKLITEKPKQSTKGRGRAKTAKSEEESKPSETTQINIIQNLLNKPMPDVSVKVKAKEGEGDDVMVPLTDFVRNGALKHESIGRSNSKVATEVNIDDAENIGSDQYVLDEKVDDFDVAPAKPPISRRR